MDEWTFRDSIPKQGKNYSFSWTPRGPPSLQYNERNNIFSKRHQLFRIRHDVSYQNVPRRCHSKSPLQIFFPHYAVNYVRKDYKLCVEKKNQLDATEWFIALVICSTCFGHFYAHHTSSILYVYYYRLWCAMPWLLVVGGQVQDSRLCVRNEGCCSRNIPHSGRIACCPAPDLRQPANKASHTIGGNNTRIFSSSWWWA